MAQRVRRRKGRCKWGVNQNDGSCLQGPRRHKLKGRGRRRKGASRRKGPAGSALYKDVMTYARGGARFACNSSERSQRFGQIGQYLQELFHVEKTVGLPSKTDARQRHLMRAQVAARKVLIDPCFTAKAQAKMGSGRDVQYFEAEPSASKSLTNKRLPMGRQRPTPPSPRRPKPSSPLSKPKRALRPPVQTKSKTKKRRRKPAKVDPRQSALLL